MKKISLRWRITLMTGMVLVLCAIALTVAASKNADQQFHNIILIEANKTSSEISTPVISGTTGKPPVLTPATENSGMFGTQGVPTQTTRLTEARKQFNSASIIALVVISVLGMGAVYIITGKSLNPITQLSQQAEAITQFNLHERVPDAGRTDEIGSLCHSFNAMLDRLDKSFQQQKQFSANVAHELKTPLATMSASVQVLRLDAEPSAEDYEKMLMTVERNTDRLKEIVENLMHLCNEQSSVEMEDVALRELIFSITEELKPLLTQRQISTEIDCEEFIVKGNYALLYRAFFNLIENAAKYNHDGGCIRVKSSTEDRIRKIEIADTGIGIQSDELEHIFEPFYRVNKSRSRKAGGSGLGLSVVKTILERHGWLISVDSTLGKGTTFTISFYLDYENP